jgi:serine/threonine protein kinase/formylglycine-generating enzyme required for sulfatase activity
MEIPGYEIEKIIGKGGMATVYLALHKALNRKVAIKVMNRQDGADSEYSNRFLREARIVANLTHPNIVTIHDVGEHDGHNYLVMELLPSGVTLKDKIKAGVDSQYALSIVRQVATALKVAHEKNIVHRDIKPDNIMFRADGSVVLMDFGVARSVDSADPQMTQAGLIIGTPQYISPEQAQGKNIGTYSDIYSLGVVFYEMLTGKVPYTADTPIALVLKHVSEPVPKLTGNVAVYQPLLDRMMAKKREQRYSNCDQIIADLDRIEAGKPVPGATKIISAAEVDEAKAAAESLTMVGDIDAIAATEHAYQPTEILRTNTGNQPADTTLQPTEILSTTAVNKIKAAAEKQGRPASKHAAKDTDKETVLTLADETTAQSTGRSNKNGTLSKLLLTTALGLLIAGGVYLFADVDIGKLKTLVGIDPGPVYSRVGRLIEIPAGTFQMGNAGGDASEKPVHAVHINAFRLGETEVTQKQWQLVMGNNTSYFKGCDNCPVDSVSWNDVQTFLKKLNAQTGLRFRLPTEAEWEYACRSAGKEEKYCGGDDASKLAWYGENSVEKTHPVAQKQANGLGLHDMSGNVWEWTQDCWHDSYDGAPSDGRAWDKGRCAQRVLRGGSWIGVAGGLSSTGRFGNSATNGSRNFGFRVAQDI